MAVSSGWCAASIPAMPASRPRQFTASIDGGCGFGGVLMAACFDRRGEIVEAIEA